jgi:hypothetical protein
MHPVDKPILVQATLLNYLSPIPDASVSVEFRRDGWSWKTQLYDDGNHNDGAAGDGVYAGYIYCYPEIVQYFQQTHGHYQILINVQSASTNTVRAHTRDIYLEPANESSTARVLKEGWNWIGFPRLDRDSNGEAPIDYSTISLAPYLTTIKAKEGSSHYINNYWDLTGPTMLNSIDGYILELVGVEEAELFESGALTEVTAVYNVSGSTWNWLTYPCDTRAYPEDALIGVINDIDYIQAQNWSSMKVNGVWVADPYSRKPLLRYGDSIKVRAINDASFYWNSTEVPPEDIRPIKTSILTYNEKAEYETLMIEGIEGNPVYDEIGVFQDGICVGARVAEGYPLQILAYTDASKEDSADLEIRIASATKGFTSLTPTIVQDYSTMSFGTSLHPSPGAFRSVNLKTGNQVVPPAFSMTRNYPNPFNPSTTITFGIPTTGVVKLDIYNVKGQKVKSLLKDNCDPGYHQIVWDGTDNGNRGVGSGIYFSRIEYNGKSQTQKMMLMK